VYRAALERITHGPSLLIGEHVGVTLTIALRGEPA
jgi:hypothetical protein